MFPVVFHHRAFTILWAGRLLTKIASLLQSTTVAWSVYAIARQTHDERQSAFLVGMLGLSIFAPMFLLALIAGETADRYDRRKIMFGCGLLQTLCAAAFALLSLQAQPTLTPFYVIAVFFGIASAFSAPAGMSMVPALVPRALLPKAIAWSSLSVHAGMVLGPWLGGALCALSPTIAYVTGFLLYLFASLTGILLLRQPLDLKPPAATARRVVLIREGLIYLWNSKIVLGAISLDLFAVLLGGATALFSAYAMDILHLGAQGYGYLRSAFAAGSVVMTLALARWPLTRHAGYWMLGGVAVYGLATVGFAVSRQLEWSMLLLAIAGMADSISVFVRQNLVQVMTPDSMRGRVSAVSGLFISASNELGEFESGVVARLLGIVGATVFGGAGSVVITGLWAKWFPALRHADRLQAPEAENK